MNVMIEQLDYMSKDAIKSNSERRGNPTLPQKIVEGTPVQAAPAASH
jgi:hypothetical protein